MAGKFVLKLIIFLAPLTLGFLFLEHRLEQIPNTYNTKKNCLENNAGSIEVLILGTSHALFGINPQYFSHAGFNLANASQSLDYDELLTFKYLPDLPRLKLVIISIGYQSLYFRIANTNENWRGFYYYQFLGVNDSSLPLIDSRRFSLFMLYTPAEVFSIMKKGFKVNYAEKLLCNGYMFPDTLANAISDSSASYRVHQHNQLIRSGNHVLIMNELEALIKTLRAKNIQVAFITPPVYTTYSSKCDATIVSKNETEINSLCAKYNCSYHNYFTDKRFIITDFNDNDHLNVEGAKKFSLLLDSELIQPEFKAMH